MPSTTFSDHLKETILQSNPARGEAVEELFGGDEKDIEGKVIQAGFVDAKGLAKLKADYYNMPFTEVESLEEEVMVRDLLPGALIKNYRMVPFGKDGDVIKVAISDPTNLQALQALEFLARKNHLQTKIFLVTEKDLNVLLQRSTGVAAEVKQAVQEFTQEESTRQRARGGQGTDIMQFTERAPVAKIVDGLLSQALAQHASDIHMEPFEDRYRVRFRVDGVLKEIFSFPKNAQSALIARVKILSDLKIDEQRLPQDGRIRFNWNGQDIDFRVSTFPTTQGEKVVLRALSRADQIPNFNQLGLTGQREAAVKKAIAASYGMLLVTGPTGSGKSTTLFVAMSQLNKPGVNIVTLEDPVEYLLPGANQAQVNPDIGFTFASGLRSILRQDPNIILVGEIRDRETAELAVHLALTGHLVFSTLHTNDAIGAIPRMVDMGVEPFLIVASVNLVLAQRLVRVICEDCKEEMPVTDEIISLIAKELVGVPAEELEGLDLKKPKLYKGKGCKKCGNTGYRGRIGIFEAVEMTKELGELTILKTTPHKLLEVAKSEGMISLKQDGFIKILKGVTTIEEVLRETSG